MRSCDLPAAPTSPPRIFLRSCEGKMNGDGKRTSYSVKEVNLICGHTSRSKQSKSLNRNACDNWRARSALKLKNKTTSRSRTRCSFAWAKISGGINSSVLFARYCRSKASDGESLQISPRPRTTASQAFLVRSQRRSRSIAKYRPTTVTICAPLFFNSLSQVFR